MIPKVIHYCWFGRNPLPESALKCIASWRKYLPNYEIKEWNESNFNVNIIPYTQEAYEAKKYAFVSDFARFWILYKYGGLYFDTDVEIIKPMEELVAKGPFLGCEIDAEKNKAIAVAPGLGMGSVPGLNIYQELLNYYKTIHFRTEKGDFNQTTIVHYTTNILKKYGLEEVPGIQQIAGIYIYPKCYFNPLEDTTGRLNITKDTYSIHWYSKTWLDVSPFRIRITRILHRIFGVTFFSRLKSFFKKKNND